MTGKYLKYLKYLKKEKIKIKGYGTRYAHTFLKAKAPKFAPFRDALCLPLKIKRELVIREKTGEIFIVFNRS